jgi:hypothetical protein
LPMILMNGLAWVMYVWMKRNTIKGEGNVFWKRSSMVHCRTRMDNFILVSYTLIYKQALLYTFTSPYIKPC